MVLVDRGIDVSDESLYATLIASRFRRRRADGGRVAGRGRKPAASIIELEGGREDRLRRAIRREMGFAEAISKHPGMEIIAAQTGEFEFPARARM
ncbi:MAG: hypothetical protein R3F11_30320 [Verrucomicrobiales bacterium]